MITLTPSKNVQNVRWE